MTMDPFADIRPYNDAEVPGVLARLLDDPEFIDAMTHLRFKQVARRAGWLLRPLVRWALRREVAGVADVDGFQHVVERYMTRMIEDTTAGFDVSGLENLEAGEPYLFISNHRDITLDPAFTNYALYHNGLPTVRIAIGDNLLTKPYVSDLMRLNKSFIVNRSATGPRQVLKTYRQLSDYIRHSIRDDRAPIWIAQREGRAKDGIDRTEPAIIKMLAMSRDKARETFAEHIVGLRIVPVSIAYELDPCDGLKAAELAAIDASGEYRKGAHEDVASIATGIAGDKGHVHVSFGPPLADAVESPEAVAARLDREIIANFRLHQTNLWAYHALHGAAPELPAGTPVDKGSCSETVFRDRLSALPEAERPFALGIYANVIDEKLRLSGSGA
jgi:hypothetical protein